MAANEQFLELFNAPVSTRPGISELRTFIMNDLSQRGQLATNADSTTDTVMHFASKLTTYGLGLESHGAVREPIEEKPIGAGTYGTIYITKARDEVIKKLWVKDKDESDPVKGRLKVALKTRGFFVEAFIQSVLSSDPTYGHFVSKPVALYRDPSLTRSVFDGSRSAGAAGSGIPDVYVFIKMEAIRYPFKKWLETEKTRLGRSLEVDDVIDLFIDLAKLLKHFDRTYEFRHGDLHTGNIMVTAGGKLKLIDFGMSCLKVPVGGETLLYRVVDYGDTTEVSRCDSFDFLIFFTAFLENQVPKFFSRAAREMFHGMFDYGSENLYDQLYAKRAPMRDGRAGEKEPVFWQTYPWELDKRVKAGGRLLRTVVNSSLPQFATPSAMLTFLTSLKTAAHAEYAARLAAHPATRAFTAAKHGGGYQTSQQFFDPAVLPPAASPFAPVISAAPTSEMIRPITYSTFKTGGSRRKVTRRRSTRRRVRGGFSPSVMGGFIPNAQAAIVPAAMYLAYHGLVRKKGSRKIASAVKKLFKGGRRFSRRRA